MPDIKNQKNKKTAKRGFSLIEVLLALLVLSIGLVAVSILMSGNIKNFQNTKNQIIASQLAQEGIELVRNLKDNDDTFTSTVTSGDYRIDAITGLLDTGSDRKLYLNSDFYVHNSAGTATKFYRKISVDISTDADDKKTATVTSTVTWNGTGFGSFSTCNVSNKCVSAVSVMPDLD